MRHLLMFAALLLVFLPVCSFADGGQGTGTAVVPMIKATVSAPYTVARVRKAKGYITIPVRIAFTGITKSIQLSVTNLPAGCTFVATDPASGVSPTMGSIDIRAGETATAGVYKVSITASHSGGVASSAPITLIIHDNTLPNNTIATVMFGSSTVDFLRVDGAINDFRTLFGGANHWTWTTLEEGAGEMAIPGSNSAEWDVGASAGYLHNVVLWGFENNSRVVQAIWPYSRDGTTGKRKWSDISPIITRAVRYLAENFDYVLFYPANPRFDTVTVSTGRLTHSSGDTFVLSGTLANTGTWLFFRNGSFVEGRKVVAANGHTVTLSKTMGSYPRTPQPGDAYTIKYAYHYEAVKQFNVDMAELTATIPTGNVRWYETGTYDSEPGFMRPDYIHLSPAFSPVQVAAMRDRGLGPFLQSFAEITVSPGSYSSPAGGASKLFTKAVSGYEKFSLGTFWPDDLMTGKWSVTEGLGSITDAGLYTPGSTAGKGNITYSLLLSPEKSGSATINVTTTLRRPLRRPRQRTGL